MKCRRCKEKMPGAIKLDSVDRNTILAALRFYQQCGMGDPANRSPIIHEIATNGGVDLSATSVGIDNLCERINS